MLVVVGLRQLIPGAMAPKTARDGPTVPTIRLVRLLVAIATSSAGMTGIASLSPVGQFQANAFGLYDMIGNAEELCSDWYGKSYYADVKLTKRPDPAGADYGTTRVIRGGSWSGNTQSCRSAIRYGSARKTEVAGPGSAW